MKRILIINSGWEQMDLLKKARSMGLYVIATDASASAPGFELAHECFVSDPRNLPELLKYAANQSIDAVTADQCDYSYYAAAYIAEVLGFPGPGLTAAQNTTNKKWMRNACGRAGVRQPEYIPCTGLNEVEAAIDKIGYPCIVKPLDNRGNFGVNRVDEPGQVKDAFYEAIANAHSRECLVEKFIEGTMITVDGFAFSGTEHRSLAVASKQMLGGRKRVAMEIDYPAAIPEDKIRELQNNHTQVARALGVRSGCTHGEYMLTREGDIYLIECANRGGGCYTSSRIVPAVSGIDINELIIKTALGETLKPSADAETMKKSVILSFFALRQGRIKQIENLDRIEQEEDILAFRLAVKEGDTIDSITNDANRHGFVIACGGSIQMAQDAVNRAKRMPVIEYE